MKGLWQNCRQVPMRMEKERKHGSNIKIGKLFHALFPRWMIITAISTLASGKIVKSIHLAPLSLVLILKQSPHLNQRLDKITINVKVIFYW